MSSKYSIIVATFNSDKTLRSTLESLLLQTYDNFELIIVDGLSTDGTVAIIKEYANKFLQAGIPYFWSSEKDSGIYDAWNKALKKVNSEWIAFLGSDDTYYPNALELYNIEIDKNPNINYISSQVEYIDEHNKVLKILGNPYNYSQMNRYMDIAHVGSFHKKELFEKYGDFSTDYKIVSDYDFFIKCGKSINAGYLKSITAKMLNSGVSNNNTKVVYNEILKIQLNHQKISKLQAYFEYYFAFARIAKNKITHKLLGKM
jgi:glycosyltransferase involved in cell wall biosynthesis